MTPRMTRSSPRATIEIALWRHGHVWLLAALLFAAIIAAYVFVLRPSHQLLTAAALELKEVQQTRARNPATTQLPEPQSEQQRLQTLQAVLQHSTEAGEVVRKMAALAQAEQIQLVQSDYQRQFHNAIRTSQVQITQPIRATYPQLRRYVESVLRTVPNVSLDQIAARRENVGQIQVEARLKWSLWIQPDAATPTAMRREPKL